MVHFFVQFTPIACFPYNILIQLRLFYISDWFFNDNVGFREQGQKMAPSGGSSAVQTAGPKGYVDLWQGQQQQKKLDNNGAILGQEESLQGLWRSVGP